MHVRNQMLESARRKCRANKIEPCDSVRDDVIGLAALLFLLCIGMASAISIIFAIVDLVY